MRNLWNWVLIISSSYSAKEAVAAMIKRLAHRNANVQLYTLEVSFNRLSYAHHMFDGLLTGTSSSVTR